MVLRTAEHNCAEFMRRQVWGHPWSPMDPLDSSHYRNNELPKSPPSDDTECWKHRRSYCSQKSTKTRMWKQIDICAHHIRQNHHNRFMHMNPIPSPINTSHILTKSMDKTSFHRLKENLTGLPFTHIPTLDHGEGEKLFSVYMCLWSPMDPCHPWPDNEVYRILLQSYWNVPC